MRLHQVTCCMFRFVIVSADLTEAARQLSEVVSTPPPAPTVITVTHVTPAPFPLGSFGGASRQGSAVLETYTMELRSH